MCEIQRFRRRCWRLLIEDFPQTQAIIHVLIGGKSAIPRPLSVEVLDLPGIATIAAARLHIDKRQALVTRMAALDGLMITEGEADDDLVVP